MIEQSLLAEEKPIEFDSGIDRSIQGCLSGKDRKSFITFAGAGSGKTYSLKGALDHIRNEHGSYLRYSGKQVAVVTFTNNAADEIKDRVERSSVFAISTIHSFCWLAIGGFNEDIRQWFLETVPVEIEELQTREKRGRAGAASDVRKRSISRLTERLEWLSEPRNFVYDPNGINSAQNSLSHTDVLRIFAHFVLKKPLMAEILVNKFPFIFVDESQDTDKGVINALFQLQDNHADKVTIGLFGDVMQRIFGGGEPELGKSVPVKWCEFDKQMNHRSARRIIGLGNAIRSEDDGRTQFARNGVEKGFVRFFLLPFGTLDKEQQEVGIRSRMAEVTADEGWIDPSAKGTAVLLLEHKMVAHRMGFAELIEALSKSDSIKGRIFEGNVSEVNFFANVVLPLAEAGLNSDEFEVMTLLRSNKSPLLEETIFDENSFDPLLAARKAEAAFRNKIVDNDVSFLEVLEVIAAHKLLNIPRKLSSYTGLSIEDRDVVEVSAHPEDTDAEEGAPEKGDFFDAWAEALQTPFFQIRGYRDYIEDMAIYRTHQGVKGNEFERVMVIMDDDEAGGFMFSYEQYLGAKELSPLSKKKAANGEETGLDRTRRLFYVTTTRAKNSLAHVIYTNDVAAVRANLIARGFANDAEIVVDFRI
jgi:DNA helicase-2/ATP-dependent DNA helicase PcrA